MPLTAKDRLYEVGNMVEAWDILNKIYGKQLANSLEYPQRIEIEWSQCLNSLSVCSLSVLCLSANFLIFCTIKYYSAVQYSMVM